MPIPTTALVILDGFGANTDIRGNAILNTPTPNLDFLWNNYTHTLLKAAEEEVGLAFGQPGNSEVGHLSLGSGRVLFQALPRINLSLADNTFFTNPAFLSAIQHSQNNHSALHIMGMVSVTGVHSHLDHFIALIDLASRFKVEPLYLHLILDGRDSGPRDASIFLSKIKEAVQKYQTGTIATISGRAYSMDRNNNQERTAAAYATLTGTTPSQTFPSAQATLDAAYAAGLDDENVLPTLIDPQGTIKPNDSLIFTNFREDRARQITHSLLQVPGLKLVTMTEYEKNLPVLVAFPPDLPPNTLSDHLQSLQIAQTHISETEKYAHVTYFFNGGRETKHPLENFIQLPSPKPDTFQSQPQMAAWEILKTTLNSIQTQPNQFLLINFANPDMIAHTGNFEATKQAVGIIDSCVGQIWKAISTQKGFLFITADHGNAESMLGADNSPTKDHTAAPVPFICAGPGLEAKSQPTRVSLAAQTTGILADVAPTILQILNLPVPAEMTGTPLFNTSGQSKSPTKPFA